MKDKLANPIIMVAVGLLVACSAITNSETLPSTQVFPTPTTHFLLQGNAPITTLDSPVSLLGPPTIASIFRMPPSATPSPIATPTIIQEFTETPLPQAPQTQFFTLAVYEDNLNPNWEVQPNTAIKFDPKSSIQVHGGHAAISFSPHEVGEATLFFTVSDRSAEMYRRDQVAKLSFWLYSSKAPLHLDQFFITIVGSNSQPYWNAKDQSVKVGDYLSVFPEVSLDELGFNHAVPADTWVMVEIDVNETLLLEPEYQYVTGISFKSATGPTHMLLIDDINLTLLGKPPKLSTLD